MISIEFFWSSRPPDWATVARQSRSSTHSSGANNLTRCSTWAVYCFADGVWTSFSVTGRPCKWGTRCSLWKEAGVYSCATEDGDWDYCCRPDHHCGYSEGYSYPWCDTITFRMSIPSSIKYTTYHLFVLSIAGVMSAACPKNNGDRVTIAIIRTRSKNAEHLTGQSVMCTDKAHQITQPAMSTNRWSITSWIRCGLTRNALLLTTRGQEGQCRMGTRLRCWNSK